MTIDELEKMERLWNERVPVRVIADEIGYSESTIEKAARMDRRRFPCRRGMTPKELDELERLWRGRKPISEISKRMGFSEQAIQGTVSRDRARFPYRHKRVPRAVAELWVEKIKAGRVTVAEAARKLGVHPVTVAGWIRRDKR